MLDTLSACLSTNNDTKQANLNKLQKSEPSSNLQLFTILAIPLFYLDPEPRPT